MEDFRTKQELEAEYGYNCNSGSPAVYVGTYAKYNSGSLYGAWFDLTKFYDYDEFMDACRELHHDEDDPELMFQDFENFPEAWYSESCMNEETFDKIREYDDLSGSEQAAFEAYIENIDSDGDYSRFQDRYVGEMTLREYAEQLVDEMISGMHLPSIIECNINYDGIARDLSCEMTEVDGYLFNDY